MTEFEHKILEQVIKMNENLEKTATELYAIDLSLMRIISIMDEKNIKLK